MCAGVETIQFERAQEQRLCLLTVRLPRFLARRSFQELGVYFFERTFVASLGGILLGAGSELLLS